jgi:hypothetical protein
MTNLEVAHDAALAELDGIVNRAAPEQRDKKKPGGHV